MFKKLSLPGIIILALAVVIAGCAPQNVMPDEGPVEKLPVEESAENNDMLNMANPAAVYCEGLGYGMENVERNGGMDADCIFPDGSRCGQWDFLSGRCGQEFSCCALQGGTLEENGNIGTCRFSDGSTCDEYQYFSGECSPGDNPGEAYEDETSCETGGIEIHDIAEARDAIIAYLVQTHDLSIFDEWTDAGYANSDTASAVTKRTFTSGPWVLRVEFEPAAPLVSKYHVIVDNLSEGLRWEGNISSHAEIEELSFTKTSMTNGRPAPASSMPPGAKEAVADWWGLIRSTEHGAQFDDYFERHDLGQFISFGIESLDPAVQAQIEALRDSGKIVHLYGTLLSNVPDYNGSQICVDKIEIEE